jgi:transketolase
VVWYIYNANTSHRAFEVTYVNNDSEVSVSSEDIIYNQIKNTTENNEIVTATTTVSNNESLPKIIIVNRSKVPGIGAEVKLKLESKGYKVDELQADFSSLQSKTVIIYSEANQDLALKLSSELDNALVSLRSNEEENDINSITVFLGTDMQP